jgi:signal transduction histidine kinase
MTITHLINNPNTAILLAAETQEKVWRFIMPFLDKQCKQHGDFMVGGYRYSELKKEMADASRRIIRSSHRIRRIIEELEG